jgi:hypothetical protein
LSQNNFHRFIDRRSSVERFLLNRLDPLPDLTPSLIEELSKVSQPVCLSELDSMRHLSGRPCPGALAQALERIGKATRHQQAEEDGPKKKHWDGNPHRVAQQEQLTCGSLAIR